MSGRLFNIIRHGCTKVIPTNQQCVFRCANCTAEFQVIHQDAVLTSAKDGEMKLVKCPSCTSAVYIPDDFSVPHKRD